MRQQASCPKWCPAVRPARAGTQAPWPLERLRGYADTALAACAGRSRASLRGGGPRQAGTRSAGVKVFCEGRAVGSGTNFLLPPEVEVVTASVSLGAIFSVKR